VFIKNFWPCQKNEERVQWGISSCVGVLQSISDKGNAFSFVQNSWAHGRNKIFEGNNNDDENTDVARVCVVAQNVIVW
jgi:hypothetical protein